MFCLIKWSNNFGEQPTCVFQIHIWLCPHVFESVYLQKPTIYFKHCKGKSTIFLHDSKWKSYFASYFSKWCSSIFIDLHLLCMEAWKIFWWHWPVLYAGYSMHLLVIKYIIIQSLCICTYFIIALLGKCKENQRACLVELDLLCMIALSWQEWIYSVPFKIISFGYLFCFVQHSEVHFDKYAFYCWNSLNCKTKNVVWHFI